MKATSRPASSHDHRGSRVRQSCVTPILTGVSDWRNPLPVRRVQQSQDALLKTSQWPATISAVGQLLRDGLDRGAATVLVGENGTGKSTLVEAVAVVYGLSPEGGSTGARHTTRASESPLRGDLSLVRGAAASRWGYFLRAETTHDLLTYLDAHPSLAAPEQRYHELSHGESFLAMLSSRRFHGDGFFVLDEPEAGLSLLLNWLSSGHCTMWPVGPAPRCSWRRTPRSWRLYPVPRFWSWTTPASTRRRGGNWISSPTTGLFSRLRSATRDTS